MNELSCLARSGWSCLQRNVPDSEREECLWSVEKEIDGVVSDSLYSLSIGHIDALRVTIVALPVRHQDDGVIEGR